MQKHFVEFFSPGTFVSEVDQKEIDSWDVEEAKEMARTIKQRHGATPYGFRFKTQISDGWEPKTTEKSGTYFLGGKIIAYKDVPDTQENRILRSNMEINGWDFIIENTNSWKVTLPFEKNDVLLDFP